MKKGGSRKRQSIDVITIGAGVVDHYARSDHFEKRKDTHAPDGYDACLRFGAKIALDELVMQTGGGATNAAVSFARLGLRTSCICRVGNDAFGDLIRTNLTEHGVDTNLVQTDTAEATGQSIILLSDIGHRSILVHRGASAQINKRDIPWKELSPRWFYITSLGGDLGLLSLLFDRAERCGASIFWNPGGGEIKKGFDRLAPFIRRVDILDVNREEAAEISGVAPRHLKRIISKIGTLPRIGLLVSDGPKGAYLHTRCCTWYAPPLPGKRVNTTGAGDALGSGFLAGFIQTCDLTIALKVGMLNALGVITHMGAKTGILPSWPSEQSLHRISIKPAKLRD